MIETNGVTVAVAGDENEAPSGSRQPTARSGATSATRLELRGRTVYLWERPPSPTQRQTMFNCTY